MTVKLQKLTPGPPLLCHIAVSLSHAILELAAELLFPGRLRLQRCVSSQPLKLISVHATLHVATT